MTTHPIYGLMAAFTSGEDVVEAARRAHKAGYRKMDAYSPYPVHGLAEALGFRGNRMALVVLVSGLIGGIAGYAMQYYSAVIDYPFIVGGRPFHSWPAFVPVTFEMTILCASFGAVLGMLGLNGLPRPYHPVFNAPGFELASRSRFFLCIESEDPAFDPEATKQFLDGLGAKEVMVVER